MLCLIYHMSKEEKSKRTDVTWGCMFNSILCTKCMDLAHFDANFKRQFVTVKSAASCDFFFFPSMTLGPPPTRHPTHGGT